MFQGVSKEISGMKWVEISLSAFCINGFLIRRLDISQHDNHLSLSTQHLQKFVRIFTLQFFKGFLKVYENFLQPVKRRMILDPSHCTTITLLRHLKVPRKNLELFSVKILDEFVDEWVSLQNKVRSMVTRCLAKNHCISV